MASISWSIQGMEKGVFWANFIQVSEVHADSPLPILLLNQHSVGQPLEIEDLINGSSLLQLVNSSLTASK